MGCGGGGGVNGFGSREGRMKGVVGGKKGVVCGGEGVICGR